MKITLRSPGWFRSLSAVLVFGAAVSAACGDSSTTSTGGNGGTGSGGATCSASPCTVSPQCGCSSTQECLAQGAGDAACFDSGDKAVGAACSQFANACVPGAVCLGFNTSGGICEKYCSEDADCGSQTCSRTESSQGSSKLCAETCDPVANSGCSAGGCLIQEESSGAKRFFTECTGQVGSGALGSDCSASQCGPGLACVTVSGAATCHQLCKVGDGSNCTSGLTCTSFSTKLDVGSTEYGSCS